MKALSIVGIVANAAGLLMETYDGTRGTCRNVGDVANMQKLSRGVLARGRNRVS